MKIIIKISCLLFCLSFFACGNRPMEGTNSERVYNSLTDYIRSLSGVRVVGSGDRANVIITKGGQSGDPFDNKPLFVVDGQQIGNTLREANSVINVYDIDRARVLSSGDATVRYGINGAYGAIEFFMKK